MQYSAPLDYSRDEAQSGANGGPDAVVLVSHTLGSGRAGAFVVDLVSSIAASSWSRSARRKHHTPGRLCVTTNLRKPGVLSMRRVLVRPHDVRNSR